MKILLAVDGSAHSVKAANYLADHFEWFKGVMELHLLHVKLPVPSGRARAAIGKDALEHYYQEEAEAALAPSRQALEQHGIPFKAAFRVGEVEAEIKNYVAANAIDLIVMGSHGHGALKNLIMGSVATKVLASTSVPVLLIR
jgi:nucleotide-binding universal stress UspA family protein